MVGESRVRKALIVIGFLLPNFAGLVLFSLAPMAASLGLSFFSWDMLTSPIFVGLGNFRSLLGDAEFWAALGHNLYFIGGYIPLVMAGGLGLAMVLNQRLRGIAFFRTAFFLPVVSSWVAVSLLWAWLFNPQYGIVNYLLSLLSITGPAWLFDETWAMPAVIVASVWKDLGYVSVLYLAGLQAIAPEFYEAASLDGATPLKSFWRITLPLLSPSTFFVLVMLLINSFQIFDQIYIMTGGGPVGATSVVVEQIYNHAFRYGQMGYASAMSWVLFALVFGATYVQTRLQRRWVHYE